MRLTVAYINPMSRAEVDQQGVNQGELKALELPVCCLTTFGQHII